MPSNSPLEVITLDEFVKRFDKVKAAGWVRSHRRGPTGIGKTLEDMLDIEENNISGPDLGEIELKSHRISSTSMLTLFTFNRDAWKMKQLPAIRKYGTPNEDGRLGLYFTMSRTAGSTGLFLYTDDENISIRHIDGDILAEWNLVVLAKQFMDKIQKVILVSAFSEMRGDDEWFRFDRAQLLSGTTPEIIRNQILSDNILIDLRLHDAGTRARNHGTGFRTQIRNLPLLFENIQEL